MFDGFTPASQGPKGKGKGLGKGKGKGKVKVKAQGKVTRKGAVTGKGKGRGKGKGTPAAAPAAPAFHLTPQQQQPAQGGFGGFGAQPVQQPPAPGGLSAVSQPQGGLSGFGAPQQQPAQSGAFGAQPQGGFAPAPQPFEFGRIAKGKGRGRGRGPPRKTATKRRGAQPTNDNDTPHPTSSASDIPAGRVRSWMKETLGKKSNLASASGVHMADFLTHRLQSTLQTAASAVKEGTYSNINEALRKGMHVPHTNEAVWGASAGYRVLPSETPALPAATFARTAKQMYTEDTKDVRRFSAKGLYTLQRLAEGFVRDLYHAAAKVQPKKVTVTKSHVDAAAHIRTFPCRIVGDPVERRSRAGVVKRNTKTTKKRAKPVQKK